MTSNKEVRDGYFSTLVDLTSNSKPLINVLTMLADENKACAADIVDVIKTYLEKVEVDVKLPVLYLIDCIIKNVGGTYTMLFSHDIIKLFCSVFEVVNEKTRGEMFKLRQTWNDILAKSKLYALDLKVSQLDPAWPVVAPQATSNIHFNPKFLQTTTIPSESPPIVNPLISDNVDSSTLDMQKQLILKQRQLLELQQKKIELELLQTSVKLQEEKMNNKDKKSVKSEQLQNLLLKPEVAKQLASAGVNEKTKNVNNNRSHNMPTTGNAAITVPSSTITRISPVSGPLVAACRPINRDPRLLRHQMIRTVTTTTTTTTNTTTVNTNIKLENKSSSISDSMGSNNKGFNNNKNIRDSRTEPRLVVNKDTTITSSHQNQTSQVSRLKSQTHSSKKTNSLKYSDHSLSSQKSSKSLSLASRSINSRSGTESVSSSRSSTTSVLDMTLSKGKSEGKSTRLSSSPTKNKKKDSTSRADKKVEKSPSKSSKCDKDSVKSGVKGDNSLSTTGASFKEVKSTTRARNYMRRNRDLSVSPEPSHDIDLRIGGPPEKQVRIQGDPTEETCSNKDPVTSQGMDVDLRQLPAVIGKKRPSTELAEAPNQKKSKTEVFDILFGSEDTDLRQLPTAISPKVSERPPTPPPPIISSAVEEALPNNIVTIKESPKLKNLDVLRAKLANATSFDKLNKSRLNFLAEQKKEQIKSQPLVEDTDYRNGPVDDSQNKIIISSQDEECIKSGNMTKEQKTALMTKIVAQMENQKLNEAKRKDAKESSINISLQPISDEELEIFSDDEEVPEAPSYKNKETEYIDKDERMQQVPQNVDENFGPRFMRGNMDIRRSNWRGLRARRGNMRQRGGRPHEPWMYPVIPNGVTWRNPPPTPYMNHKVFPPFAEDLNTDALYADNESHETHEIIVDRANHDNIKSINIDGIPRDIRYYDEIAVAFMDWDNPREISFQNGSRKVSFDDFEISLNFNEPYFDINIKGNLHKVRLGGPTREIYIDGDSYECYFGGPSIAVELDGKVTYVKLEGPPPQVKIGPRRIDLVAGKVNMVIDAKNVIPLFLDGKIQKFEIDGKIQTLKFIDSLRRVQVNDIVYDVMFGDLPKPMIIMDRKRFVRFSVLPRDVKPGYVRIKGMEGIIIEENSLRHDENGADMFPAHNNDSILPAPKRIRTMKGMDSPDRNSNSPSHMQNVIQQNNLSNLDMLSSVMTSTLMPPQNLNVGGYQVENVSVSEPYLKDQQDVPTTSTSTVPLLPTSININDLFQKLVATGIVTSIQENPSMPNILVPPPTHQQHPLPQPRPLQERNKKESLSFKPVNFSKPESLKARQPALIQILYFGMQCSSCGMRFPPEHSMQYSQHLDWHFRQNRKGKKNIRKAASRRWYYLLSDWKNYEEIEDLEEREKSYFESQQAQNEGGAEEAEEDIEIPTVSADPSVQDAKCEVCQDRFDQFYNEEKEEWQLRMAIKIDNKNYHPLCYEDYQASLVDTIIPEEAQIPGIDSTEPDENTVDEKQPIEIVIDDDDGEKVADVDEEIKEESALLKEPLKEEEEEEDDDVILNEVAPEKIDLVDDDCKDDEIIDTSSNNSMQMIVKEEPLDDGFMDVEDGVIKVKGMGEIKIKSEPFDPDYDIQSEDGTGKECIEEEEIAESPSPEATHMTEVVALIDGNVEFESSAVTPASSLSGKIKINISKPLPVIPPRENKDVSSSSNTSEIEKSIDSIDPSQPLPPGEEHIQLNLKPALQGIKLKNNSLVKRGTELSGLCSIM